MDIKNFTEKSQDYLSKLFYETTFNPDDEQTFIKVDAPVRLNDIEFRLFMFKTLTGYKPSNSSQNPVLYTFFLLTPPAEMKLKFLDEVNKKKSGLPFDEKIISEYYLPVFPERADFKGMINGLVNLFETKLFVGKGYHFAFHLVCPTEDYNFALIFIETNSVSRLASEFEGNVPFDN
jgi:hypothetical protein